MASGKGGTGKTTVAAALAYLLSKRLGIVAVDADVDAPDLSLALGGGTVIYEREVVASQKARVELASCTGCGACVPACSYGAIGVADGSAKVYDLLCEGCGVCTLVCPSSAITVEPTVTGRLLIEETRHGFPLVTGRLRPGEHNSGRLVSEAKQMARSWAERRGAGLILVDAAPGIGCPVIASLSGASFVVAVVEPTPTSRRNFERLVKVARHFNTPVGLVVNKLDLDPWFARRLEEWALIDLKVPLLAELPVDYEALRALTSMKPLPELNPSSKLASALTMLAERVEVELHSL